jgi:hypothetical protein
MDDSGPWLDRIRPTALRAARKTNQGITKIGSGLLLLGSAAADFGRAALFLLPIILAVIITLPLVLALRLHEVYQHHRTRKLRRVMTDWEKQSVD